MKINNIILVLHTCIILLSSFVIYFSVLCHLEGLEEIYLLEVFMLWCFCSKNEI